MAGRITKTEKVSLDANETIDNILEGTKLENVPSGRNYNVVVLAQASSDDVRHKIEADTDVAVQDSIVGSQDRVPIRPDDLVDTFAVEGGTKLFVQARETGGSAQTYYYKIILIPRR
jgi:hypothetical protein